MQFARDGGALNARKKAALDSALAMHAQAAAQLKMDPSANVPAFGPA